MAGWRVQRTNDGADDDGPLRVVGHVLEDGRQAEQRDHDDDAGDDASELRARTRQIHHRRPRE